MGRKTAREESMKLIYQFLIQKDNWKEQFKEAMENNTVTDEDAKFIESRVSGVSKHSSEIDKLIMTHAKGWKLSRMPRIDLAILRLSIYEMKIACDTPVSVCINEAVELAKKYSTEESGSFINGILGRIAGLLPENKENPGDQKGEITC